LVTCVPNSREANNSAVPRSFGRASATGPGGRLDRHLPVPITRSGPRIAGQRRTRITVPAEELGDLGLQRRLHQQLRAEPGDLLQDLLDRPVLIPYGGSVVK
jgi:hypothetical protein